LSVAIGGDGFDEPLRFTRLLADGGLDQSIRGKQGAAVVNLHGRGNFVNERLQPGGGRYENLGDVFADIFHGGCSQGAGYSGKRSAHFRAEVRVQGVLVGKAKGFRPCAVVSGGYEPEVQPGFHFRYRHHFSPDQQVAVFLFEQRPGFADCVLCRAVVAHTRCQLQFDTCREDLNASAKFTTDRSDHPLAGRLAHFVVAEMSDINREPIPFWCRCLSEKTSGGQARERFRQKPERWDEDESSHTVRERSLCRFP
jgi:hypothetical protein